jgi:hypothetical protein
MPTDRVAGKPGFVTATYTVWCVTPDCCASYTARDNASRTVSEYSWMGVGWCRFESKWHCPQCAAAYVPLGLRHVTGPAAD